MSGLLGLTLIAALVFAGTSTTLLPIETVEVTGARHLRGADVLEVSGLVGQPIFRASSFVTATRLRALPALRGATVEIAFPGSARIVIDERVALGRWVAAGSEWFVDEEGVVFASPDPSAAPELRVFDERSSVANGIRLHPALVAAAFRLARIAPGELRGDTAAPRVIVDRGGSLVWRSGADWEIRFGGHERLEEKLSIVRAFLQRNPDRRLDYVDVARPEFIVVRPE